MLAYLLSLTPLAKKAQAIQKSFGTRRAAGFLRNQGVPMLCAVGILARS